MTGRPGPLLALGGFAVLVTLLVGLSLWTSFSTTSGSSQTAFTLEASGGRTISEDVFKGRPTLVSFGYTHCPDVCPTTLFEMAGWLEALGAEGQDLQALFITVDPERDTMAVVEPYVAAFSERITGVTGEPAEIARVMNAWQVGGEQDVAVDGDYSMLHTTSVLMIGRNGRLAGLLPYDTSNEAALGRIRAALL